MNSSPEPDLSLPSRDGDSIATLASRDPFEALDDLMVAIEGLCPVWPDKDIPRVTVGFLL